MEWEVTTIDRYKIQETTRIRTDMDLKEAVYHLNLLEGDDRKFLSAKNLTPWEERELEIPE